MSEDKLEGKRVQAYVFIHMFVVELAINLAPSGRRVT